MAGLIDKIDESPDTFDFTGVPLPRSLLSDEPRVAKFHLHLNSYAALKCQEADVGTPLTLIKQEDLKSKKGKTKEVQIRFPSNFTAQFTVVL